MTTKRTPKQVREAAEILHTGRWYIAELEEPQLAVQGESKADAVQKLIKRWQEYTVNLDDSDIRLGTSETDADHRRPEAAPSPF